MIKQDPGSYNPLQMVSKYMTRKDLIDAKINSLIEVQTYVEQEIERLTNISKKLNIEEKENGEKDM